MTTANTSKCTIGNDYAHGLEIKMPFGLLLVIDGRPVALLPNKGAGMVNGLMHHTKYGFQRGVGAMWLRERTGKETKTFRRECALALVGHALVGGWEKAFVEAGQDGRAPLLKRIEGACADLAVAAVA